MALIKCLECEKEISDKAATCPHCGAPVLLAKKNELSWMQKFIMERDEDLKRISLLPNKEQEIQLERHNKRFFYKKMMIFSTLIVVPLIIFATVTLLIRSCAGSDSSHYHSVTKEDAEMKEVIRKLDALDAAKEKNSHYY